MCEVIIGTSIRTTANYGVYWRFGHQEVPGVAGDGCVFDTAWPIAV